MQRSAVIDREPGRLTESRAGPSCLEMCCEAAPKQGLCGRTWKNRLMSYMCRRRGVNSQTVIQVQGFCPLWLFFLWLFN